MAHRRRRLRAQQALWSCRLDLLDLAVVGVVAVLVGLLVVVGAIFADDQTRNAAYAPPLTSVPVSTPTSTSTAKPVVSLLATAEAARPLAAGLADAAGVSVRPVIGSGYLDGAADFGVAAAKVPADAPLVVIVPSNADGIALPLQETAGLAHAVEGIKKVAPDAEILVVGPVAGDAEAGSVKAVGGALFNAARTAKLHYIAGTGRGWVGAEVDTTNGFPTADALKTVGAKLGTEVKKLLAA